MSSKPRIWSAWPWVSRMASRRSRPARRACWRKSGVVSMTTFFPCRESSSEGRSRLSWGSFEVHTRQCQPKDGTPIEVPEPRTVTFMGAGGMIDRMALRTASIQEKKRADHLGARFRFGLGRLCRGRLIDFDVSHFHLCNQIEEQVVRFGREIALRFFVKGIEHIDEFAGRVGIDHRLAGARISIGAQYHRGIAAEHANKILECRRGFGRVRRRLRRGRRI